MSKLQLFDITGEIIGAAYEVHRTLGPGFLESIYDQALRYELRLRQLPMQPQVEVPVYYKHAHLGTHILDLIVADKVIVELKVAKELADIHTAITLSYLKATNLPVAI